MGERVGGKEVRGGNREVGEGGRVEGKGRGGGGMVAVRMLLSIDRLPSLERQCLLRRWDREQ